MSTVAMVGNGRRGILSHMVTLGAGMMGCMLSFAREVTIDSPSAKILSPTDTPSRISHGPYRWRKTQTASQRKRKPNRLHISRRTKAKHSR